MALSRLHFLSSKAIRPSTVIGLRSPGYQMISPRYSLIPVQKTTTFAQSRVMMERMNSRCFSSKRKGISKKQDGQVTNTDLDQTIKSIESAYGKGTVMKLGDSPDNAHVSVISTGSIGLDAALGTGGLPRGRVVEIYGPESSGKTTLALQVIAEAHKLGGKCCFIDAEHALDPSWAKRIGVKIDELLVCQPDSGEQGLDITELLVQEGNMDVIVIDSVAALVPKAELEGEMGDYHIGTQARLMSQALRKLTGSLARTNKTILIFINQIRHKIGITFGSPETTTGGNALKFYCSQRLEIRRTQSLKRGDAVTGNQVRVKVVKNKLAPPYREAHFDIEFGKGISKVGELVDLGIKTKVLDKAGSWYSYQGNNVGQGRDKTKAYLEQNPKVAEEIEIEVRKHLMDVTRVGDFDEPTEEPEEEES